MSVVYSVRIFHDQVALLVVLEVIVQLDDVVVVQRVHYADFVQHLLVDLVFQNEVFLDLLHSEFFERRIADSRDGHTLTLDLDEGDLAVAA